MSRLIVLGLRVKLLSYNQYYRNSRTGRRIKTGAGLAYDEVITDLLNPYKEDLIEFGDNFDPEKEAIEISILNYKKSFFRKDGKVSKTSGDWDNPIKVIQDKIFSVIGVDDYVICRGSVTCIPSSLDHATIYIKTIPIPCHELPYQ